MSEVMSEVSGAQVMSSVGAHGPGARSLKLCSDVLSRTPLKLLIHSLCLTSLHGLTLHKGEEPYCCIMMCL